MSKVGAIRRKRRRAKRGDKISFLTKVSAPSVMCRYFILHDKLHDLKVERFLHEPPDGPMKTFTLRGIKESPS